MSKSFRLMDMCRIISSRQSLEHEIKQDLIKAKNELIRREISPFAYKSHIEYRQRHYEDRINALLDKNPTIAPHLDKHFYIEVTEGKYKGSVGIINMKSQTKLYSEICLLGYPDDTAKKMKTFYVKFDRIKQVEEIERPFITISEEVPVVFDALGTEIKVGDFVFAVTNGMINMGIVSKIPDKNRIEVTRQYEGSRKKGGRAIVSMNTRCPIEDRIVVMNKDIMERIMMKKLYDE